MDEGYNWLESIADRMKRDVAKGAAPRAERLTVRELLEKFGFQRRSDRINNHIRNGLDRLGLRTDQDITVVWLDSSITIELDSEASGASETPRTSDPTYRVSMIPAANRKPVSVERDNSPEGSDHRHADERLFPASRHEERAGRRRNSHLGVNRHAAGARARLYLRAPVHGAGLK